MTVQGIYTILQKKHLSFSKKIFLLSAFCKVRVLRFLVGRIIPGNALRTIKMLGYSVSINTFNDFFWTFYEVFIEEEYYFHATDTQPVIVDLGGHIGLPVLYFKWLYPEAKITVFEPLPENAAVLQKNIERNKLDGVLVETSAVTGVHGMQSFMGAGRAGHVISSRDARDEEEAIQVKTVPLSGYINEPIAFCKMDIEGSEQAVIEEMAKSNKLHFLEYIVMEYHAENKNNVLSRIIHMLEEVSFDISFKTDLQSTNLKKRDFTHLMVVGVKR